MALRSKFFRVAQEGTTTDGREITRDQITQMAANYDQSKYGARVWLEHFRGLFPDSSFKALGDVVDLETREEDGKLGLYAQIEPHQDLVKMNKDRQKIYSSIELDPKFSDSDEAYLVGLAVTDSPASLGTEALQFSANRKQREENNFSSGESVEIEFEEFTEKTEKKDGPTLLSKVKEMFSKSKNNADEQFSDVADSVIEIAEEQQTFSDSQTEQNSQFTAEIKQLKEVIDAQEQRFTDLVKKLGGEKDKNHSDRPESSGGSGEVLTDC